MGFSGIYHLEMTNSLLLKMTIEIVDVPITSMVMFHSYLRLPEVTVTIWVDYKDLTVTSLGNHPLWWPQDSGQWIIVIYPDNHLITPIAGEVIEIGKSHENNLIKSETPIYLPSMYIYIYTCWWDWKLPSIYIWWTIRGVAPWKSKETSGNPHSLGRSVDRKRTGFWSTIVMAMGKSRD